MTPIDERPPTPRPAAGSISRRALLGSLPALAIAQPAVAKALTADTRPARSIAAFGGGHQQGVATARPTSLTLAAFDVTGADRAALVRLLIRWSSAIEQLTAGRAVGSYDSGEAVGLAPAALTVTIGFGPSLFDARFGLQARRPPALVALPSLRGDRLQAGRSDGDLVVQACSDDAVVAAHAVRQLRRLGEGSVRLRWQENGYAPPPAAGRATPGRNPLGFEDGTGNPVVGSDAFDAAVWVPDGGAPAWLAGGTCLCYRRIRLDLVTWDRLSTLEQQLVIGRRKASGAPLSGGGPDAPLQLAARTADGRLAIPAHSHVHLAAAQTNDGATIYRRSFAYDDGADADGDDTGLLFLAYAAEPSRQFTPILSHLAGHDRLNRYLTHTASGVWALPPAPAPGGWLGQTLLG